MRYLIPIGQRVLLAVVLTVLLPLFSAQAATVAGEAEVTIQLNDQVVAADWQLWGEEPPLIPLRELAKSVGAQLIWEKETGLVYYFYGDRAVAAHPALDYIYIVAKEPPGEEEMADEEISSVLNWQVVEYPGPLLIRDGVTYAGAGFLNYLGMEAFWDENYSRLDIALDPQIYGGGRPGLSYFYVAQLLADDVGQKLAALPRKIASFTTSFNAKDINRTINIKLAAASLDGAVIETEDRFSFNQTVGPRTPQRGYLEAIIFVNNDKILGYGGGVCQVSSTLYNTALLAGLEIIERHQHSLPVSYLPLGSEATVAYGSKDLVFRNCLDQKVTIKCWLGAGSLTVEMWQ